MLAFILLLLLSGETIVSCLEFVGTEVKVFRFDDASPGTDVFWDHWINGYGTFDQPAEKEPGRQAIFLSDEDRKSPISGRLLDIDWINTREGIDKHVALMVCQCIDKSDMRRQKMVGNRGKVMLAPSKFYEEKKRFRAFLLRIEDETHHFTRFMDDEILQDLVYTVLPSIIASSKTYDDVRQVEGVYGGADQILPSFDLPSPVMLYTEEVTFLKKMNGMPV